MTSRLVLPLILLPAISPAWGATGTISGRLTDAQGRPVFSSALRLTATSGTKTIGLTPLLVAAQGMMPGATTDKSYPSQLSGTVVDASGAVVAGAVVQLRGANGTIQKTLHSDQNGSFNISGLEPGNYRLVVSNPGFATKEMPVTIGGAGAPAPLRISLAVSAVSTAISVQGREDDLVGIAQSATQGTAGAKEIEDRPILRAGEILETVPGVIITQHAGGGKANQYFLRGFNLDHGTDFAIYLDGMPLNLPSHAHGEGYSDMNTVIDEFVQRVNYEKGPYYPEVGDYGSAGSAHLDFFKTLPENFIKVEGGTLGYARGVFGASQKLGSGNLLEGGEAYYDDGPWTHPDGFAKFNGLLTYSQGGDANGFSITSRSYHGKWNSSDQLPVDTTPLVGTYGTLNPADGGHSGRYSLQGEWHHATADSVTQITAYGFYYDLDLFSDFTYYLDDPNKGDQFEQQDGRSVAGVDAHHTIFSHWVGRRVENTFGLQVRNDWVNNGLYRTENRIRTDKNDGNACNDEPIDECTTNPNLVAVLPADTDLNRFTDTLVGFYAENKIQWTAKFRTVLALRGDDAAYHVNSLTPSYVASELPGAPVINFAELNSGFATKFVPEPKLSFIFGPWADTEFYAQGGFSYHSNDARGSVQREEPISPDFPFPTPCTPITPLVETRGAETGVRTAAVPRLQSTLSLWYLRSESELQQDGDTGGTVASLSPSNRYGIEWANYYTPLEHWAFDFDIADSRARFTAIDPDDAAYTNVGGGPYPVQGPGGYWVPEAVGVVIASGVTLHGYRGFSASLRLRDFGPRNLTSDAIYRSRTTTLLNSEVGHQIREKWRVYAELLNLLNNRDHDIDYAYVSRITPTAAPEFTDVFHPVEPIQVRVGIERTF